MENMIVGSILIKSVSSKCSSQFFCPDAHKISKSNSKH